MTPRPLFWSVQGLVASILLLVMISSPSTLGQGAFPYYNYHDDGAGGLHPGDSLVIDLPSIPSDQPYFIHLSVTTEVDDWVDIQLEDEQGEVLFAEGEVNVTPLKWWPDLDDEPARIVIVPSEGRPSTGEVVLSWNLYITNEPEDPVHASTGGEERTTYWTNSTVLVLGVGGVVAAAILLLFAVGPFRTEPGARKDLATVRFHQQKMR